MSCGDSPALTKTSVFSLEEEQLLGKKDDDHEKSEQHDGGPTHCYTHHLEVWDGRLAPGTLVPDKLLDITSIKRKIDKRFTTLNKTPPVSVTSLLKIYLILKSSLLITFIFWREYTIFVTHIRKNVSVKRKQWRLLVSSRVLCLYKGPVDLRCCLILFVIFFLRSKQAGHDTNICAEMKGRER